MSSDIFQRTELLLGSETMDKLSQLKVIVFGIGGVGSWCVESLVRSGIGNITIVDSDTVASSNINRQIHATTLTVGKPKTEVMKARLLEINPNVNITAIQKIYDADSCSDFELDKYDYIIDAIDSIYNKVHLLRTASNTQAVLFSSMGASLKMNPEKISVAEFWNVKGCPLGARVRKIMRQGELPAKKFLCVYSEELLENKGAALPIPRPDNDNDVHDWSTKKAVINGTVSYITAIFGFTLAGLVIQDIAKR